QGLQHGGQLHLPGGGLRAGKAVQLQGVQHGVHRPDSLAGLDEPGVQGVGHQPGSGLVAVHAQPSSKPWGWLLCQAQAEETMVSRSAYWGFQPRTVLAFSEEATSWAGSPARRGEIWAGMGWPVTFRATSTTSFTEKPTP